MVGNVIKISTSMRWSENMEERPHVAFHSGPFYSLSGSPAADMRLALKRYQLELVGGIWKTERTRSSSG